jgi:hypothetical protein
MDARGERASQALPQRVLHGTAQGAHAKPQRVLHGAPPRIPRVCYQAAAPRPHGRAYRSPSWFSDAICDGMLPVRELRANELHNSGGHRRINAGCRTRASRAMLPQTLLHGTALIWHTGRPVATGTALRVPAKLHAYSTRGAATATVPRSSNESTPHGSKE